MEKGRISIGQMMGIYIFSIICLLFITAALSVISVTMWLNSASYAEPGQLDRDVESWISESKVNGVFDTSSFPKGAGCIIIGENGEEIYTRFDTSGEKALREFISEFENTPECRILRGQDVYLKAGIGGKSAYIHYSLRVKYEYTVFILIILVFALVVVVPTVIVIRKINKAVKRVEDHAERLKDQDLSEKGVSTGIREIDEISLAIDSLRDSLSESLEAKWKDEQRTKTEMAQIAHDLKTPLTIIRGNADLLLENTDNDEDRESLQSIIENAEKISRSVLEILERQSP